MFLWFPYFSPKSLGFFCIRLLVCFRVTPSLVRISFRCLRMSYFVCIVLPFVDISLTFLLWPVFSGLFPQVVLLFFLMLPVFFSPPPRLFQRLSSSFGLVFVVFFICDSSLISHPGFCCFLVLFKGDPNILTN